MSSLMSRDEKWIWHPYTQHGLQSSILPVRRAQGSYLELEDGRTLLDAISSWWVNGLGHCHPRIAQAIAAQAKELEHVIFAGFTHAPAVDLAQALIEATQERGADFTKVFYSDNGSTAVEVALKMAYQFHQNRGAKHRTRFIALRGSYHGDTLGAMAVGEPEGFHTCFRPLLAPVDFIEPGRLDELRTLLNQNPGQYAGLIVEPLIQGAGGMRVHSAEFLKGLAEICRQEKILLIFDEVFTGFYRTGKAFAFEKAHVAPDLICFSKVLTGGFLPLAVTLSTQEVFDQFKSQELGQAFLHGHSYTANPLACAAALATWRELIQPETQRQIQKIEEITQERLLRIKNHPAVHEVRSMGTIGIVELQGESGYFSQKAPLLRRKAIEKGVLLRPLGNVIYTAPPYCFTESELHFTYTVIEELLDLSLSTEDQVPWQDSLLES